MLTLPLDLWIPGGAGHLSDRGHRQIAGDPAPFRSIIVDDNLQYIARASQK
jgi:hypothetical protein